MKSETWRRVEALFDTAIALDPDRRRLFVDGVDEPLRSTLIGLLESHDEMGPHLRWLEEEGEVPPFLSSPMVGQRVGAYRIVGEIGRGGMGEVYLALRDDDEYHKAVCLKVARRGAAAAALEERFRQERQILAGLDHESIARLIDGGTGSDGRPFLVMEYIPGRAIHDYCDEERLSVNERLRLFLRVCAAVHYAHQRLVVHQDLKPSNILITAEGVPKLLDFGIAKLLDPEPRRDSAASAGDPWALTPEYASPEQLRGEPVTTATDVFSLGVLLHELLTGERPLQPVPDEAGGHLARCLAPSSVVAGCPASVSRRRSESRRTTPRRLQRHLRGDLDRVLARALEVDASRRYASVEGLADDVRRFLEIRPLEAAPDGVVYRAKKFLRRRRLPLLAASALLASLVGGIVGTARMAVVARHSEALARQAQGAAEAALMRAERHREQAQRARVQAETRRQEAEEASAVAEASRRQSEAARGRLEGIVRLLEGFFGAADPHGYKSLGPDITVREMLVQAARRVDAEPVDLPEVAAVHDLLGRAFLGQGLLEEAEAQLRAALDRRRRLYGDEHPEVATSLLHIHHGLFTGKIWADQVAGRRDYVTAIAELERAVAIRRRHLGDQHPLTAEALSYLSSVQRAIGHPLAQETLDTAIVALINIGFGQGKLSPAEAMAVFEGQLARIRFLWSQGQAEKAYAFVGATLRPFLEHDVLGELVWGAVCSFAEERKRQGDEVLAEALFYTGVRLAPQTLDVHPDVGRFHWALGHLLRERGALEEAEVHYRQTSAIFDRRLELEDGRRLLATSDHVATLLDLGEVSAAEVILKDATAVAARVFPAESRPRALLARSYGRLLMDQGRYGEAETVLESSLKTLQDLPERDDAALERVRALLRELRRRL